MKTFLTYLTFAALLALCYVEKINAEAARNQVRSGTGGDSARADALVRAEPRAVAAQLRE